MIATSAAGMKKGWVVFLLLLLLSLLLSSRRKPPLGCDTATHKETTKFFSLAWGPSDDCHTATSVLYDDVSFN